MKSIVPSWRILRRTLVFIGLAALLGTTPVFMSAIFASDASPPAAARKVILVLGDSLAAGYGLDPSEAFPALLQDKVDAKGWPYKVVNAGVSGDTSAGGLRRLDWLLKQTVDILVVELGGNDGLRGISPETTRSNLQAIIDRTRTKYPNVEVVIAGMRMPPNLGPDYVERFEKVFTSVAEEKKAALVPFLLEGVGGRPELNQADRVHPTARGQRFWRRMSGPCLNLSSRKGPRPLHLFDRVRARRFLVTGQPSSETVGQPIPV